MKISVFAQQLVVGGTSINGIELAAALRDIHGHDVVLFATPGPLLSLVEEKNLRFDAGPEVHRHPSLMKMRALRAHVRRERPDVIHAWDWSQCLDAYFGAHIPSGVPLLVTDMLMHVNRVLPKRVSTTFGTPELVARARRCGRKRVELLVPPVDTQRNAPGVVNAQSFRTQYGIGEAELLLVTVSRLDPSMKADSLCRTIAAVATLGREQRVRLVLVGGGGARPMLERLAAECNSDVGYECVTFTGELIDPRFAYSAADIVVGMGSSALRGMAFQKPVIVVGEAGFASLFNEDTAEQFFYTGMFGRGDGSPSNCELERAIRSLAGSADYRGAVGRFAREFVVRNFSLETVSANLSDLLTNVVAEPRMPVGAAIDVGRTMAMYIRDRVFLWRSVAPEQKAT